MDTRGILMKITLTFDDANDDGNFEMQKAQRCVRADEVFSLLWDIDQKCRAWLKWDDTITETEEKKLSEIRDEIAMTGILDLYT